MVLADAGYCNEADLVALEERGIDGYVALGREGKARVAVDPAHTRAATHRMGEKLARAKGKAQYAQAQVDVRGTERLGQGGAAGSDGSACGAWTEGAPAVAPGVLALNIKFASGGDGRVPGSRARDCPPRA